MKNHWRREYVSVSTNPLAQFGQQHRGLANHAARLRIKCADVTVSPYGRERCHDVNTD